MPPVARIIIELPSEYQELPAPGQTPPYTSFSDDSRKLVEIQTAVMRRYGSAVKQNLNAFRQEVGLSDNQINMRTTPLGSGVGMKYASQFGNEAISITVSAQAVRELLGEEDDGYMLVIFNSGGVNKVAGIPMKDLDTLGKKVYTTKTIGWSRGASQYYGTAQLKAASNLHVAATYISIAADGTVSDTDRLNYYNVHNTILGPAVTSPTNAVYTSRPLINFTGRVFYDNCGNKADFSQSTPTCTVVRPWITRADSVAAVDKTGVLWGFSRVTQANGIRINNISFANRFFADAHQAALDALYIGLNGWDGGTAGPDQSGDFYVKNPTIAPQTIPLNQRVMVYSNNGSVDNVTLSISSGSISLDQTAYQLANATFFGLDSVRNTTTSYTEIGPQYIYSDGSYEFGTDKNTSVMWGQQIPDGAGYVDSRVYTPAKTYDGLFPVVGTYIFAANGNTSIRVIDPSDLYFVNQNIVMRDKTDITTALFSSIGAATTAWVHAIFLGVKKADIDKLK
jgi:hypothetical protein